jgi:hypothetical protein
MAFLRRFSAASQQPGDHCVTRYLSPVTSALSYTGTAASSYTGTAASQYQAWSLEDFPAGKIYTAHFRYSGWVWFGGAVIMLKDGYFMDWMSTFSTGESPDFMPEAPELWEGDEKQVEFEAGLSSCGLLPWWEESCPLWPDEERRTTTTASAADATTTGVLPSSRSNTPPTSNTTTSTINDKWGAMPPKPKFFGTFDPARYGLPRQYDARSL